MHGNLQLKPQKQESNSAPWSKTMNGSILLVTTALGLICDMLINYFSLSSVCTPMQNIPEPELVWQLSSVLSGAMAEEFWRSPRKEKEQQFILLWAKLEEARMNEKYILLAEDNENDVLLTRRVLKKYQIDYGLVVVSNGQQALDFLSSKDLSNMPSVVLLDIKLPLV